MDEALVHSTRLISAVAPSFLLALTLTLSLSRSPSGSNAKQTLKPEGDRDFPVLEEYAQSDEEYSKAIENRSVIIQEFDLENEPPLWNHTDTLLKVFPPAFRCPHKVSQLGKVAVCGPLEHLIKQDSCIVYSLAPPEDLHSLQAALAETVGDGKCDVFGYNLDRYGIFDVALPSINNAGPDVRAHVWRHLDNATVGEAEEDTEEYYASPWTRIRSREHAFIHIVKFNYPARRTHWTLLEGSLLRSHWLEMDGGPSVLRIGSNVRRVGHLILKLRLDQVRYDGTPMQPFLGLKHMWEELEFVGFRPFAASVGDDGYAEYSFVNIHIPLTGPLST